MPHVEPLLIENAPEKSQPILKAIEKKYRQPLNIFSTLAYLPDALLGVTKINDGLTNSLLDDKYRELAYYKASRINQCDYCSHYHQKAAEKAGVEGQQFEEISRYAESSAFDDKERAVLAYAEQLTIKAKVEESVVKTLKTFLNDEQMVALSATVALANFTNRFNHGLDIQLP